MKSIIRQAGFNSRSFGLLLLALTMSILTLSACGDKTGDNKAEDRQKQLESGRNNKDDDVNRGEEPELNAGRAHEYTGKIDVNLVDINHDGKVYECPMDWNVLADEPGKCPKCKMDMKDYSVAQARENLKINSFEVK